jgi:enoyl-CoA hydratase/carnithine racemase
VGEFVRLDVDDASRVGTIRLDRPPVNALNAQVQRELGEAAREAGLDDRVGAVVIWGGEKVFAAGADIKEMEGRTFAEVSSGTADLQGAFTALARIPKVVIAAVTGYALGGGCELALTADFRFAADDARFGQPEILLGIIPGAGGTQRLPRLVGPAKALEMNTTGEPVSAEEAFEYGLVNRLVPDHELFDTALAWARKFSQQAPLALENIKRASHQGDLDDGIAAEKEAFAAVFASEDAREGISAFLQKRQPEFKGK